MEECLDFDNTCNGELYPWKSMTGMIIYRCEKHLDERLELEERLNRDYPDSDIAPYWFDPDFAGEYWNDDY